MSDKERGDVIAMKWKNKGQRKYERCTKAREEVSHTSNNCEVEILSAF